ncbi:MAG: isoprenylcysteine carboxylmethyltransferase family protein [Chloroflexota bacterium]
MATNSKRKGFGGILVASALIVAQYILAFFVLNMPGIPALHWLGWAVWALSLYFGFAPMFILRQKGEVAKGESYVRTKKLVDTSLYAIVRHPQYLAGILFNLAMMLLAQHWLVIVMGVISMALIYYDMYGADQEGIEKFGDEYREYMQRVPRANFLLGLARWMRAKRTKQNL